MGDESDPITAVAKAAEETAKTGRALVEAGSDLAGFIGKALGTVPEDTVGLLGGNLLRELHIRNLDKISRKTEEILRQRGVEEPEPIGPKALLPALEAASEETDETLQEMWAGLLANSMDPNKDTSLQRIFIDTLRQMESIDALVLRRMAERATHKDLNNQKLSELLGCRESLAALSVERLMDQRVLRGIGTKRVPHFNIAALGMELYLACQSDAPD